jgi:hypothetical protein
MDVLRAHHHRRDRVRRARALVERRAAGVGRRPRRHGLLRLRHLLLGLPAVPLLQIPRPGEKAEELHLHGCRQDAPRYPAACCVWSLEASFCYLSAATDYEPNVQGRSAPGSAACSST